MEISHRRHMVSALQQAGPTVTTGLPVGRTQRFLHGAKWLQVPAASALLHEMQLASLT